MINDLSSVKGYAQAAGYFSAIPTGLGANNGAVASDKSKQNGSDITLTASQGTFPALSEAKDNATRVAKAVNQASKALDKADALLGRMEEQVGMVKNYPPYPAGNEDRAAYIKGIEGLRKQIDALDMPKVTDSFPPVFYPKELNFPELDAKVPSDAAVLAFGDAVQVVKQRVNEGRVELRAQAEQIAGQVGNDFPPEQARAISVDAANQLSTNTSSLAGNSGAFIQLVG